MQNGIYIGSNKLLKGKTALVFVAGKRCQCSVVPDGVVMVQVNDTSTGLGHGWHEFKAEDWKMEIQYHCSNCNTTFGAYQVTTWCPACNIHGYTYLATQLPLSSPW